MNSLWERFEPNDPQTVFCAQQDFPPDGISVLIYIKHSQKGYEIWSSAEHRISGPYDVLVGIQDRLADALKAAEAECASWEEFFREHASGNYSVRKPRRKSDGSNLCWKRGERMSVDLIVQLSAEHMPSPEEWQAAISAQEFSLKFTHEFEVRSFSGYLPSEIEGEPAGFEYFYEVIGEPGEQHVQVTLVTRSDLREF